MTEHSLQENKMKLRVQRYITIMSVVLLVGKFVAYFLTNSVGILTDAMESIVNVSAGFISLYALYLAAKPRDDDHPFGHGKVESLSASIEGILIIAAGGIIIYEGIIRIFSPAPIQQLDIGIIIIATAGLINYLAGWYSIRVGRRYDSIALVAGGKHLQSDTYSTIGLVAGLLIMYFTGIHWIDSVLALIFGSIIIVTGISILRKTTANLMDKADNEILETIVKTINANRKDDWVDVHNTKVVKYGNVYHIDCDLTVPWYYNTRQGHACCDELRRIVAASFSRAIEFSIHSDPCTDDQCPHCRLCNCHHRQAPLMAPNVITIKTLTETDEDDLPLLP